jgi:endonuclease YncB( thermonuclease family)
MPDMRFILCFFLALVAFPVPASAAQYRVAHVADGDTITVVAPDRRRIKIRLYGIDCPESGQAFGARAKRATIKAVAGRDVVVRPMDTDRYGRTVAVVSIPGDDESLNAMLVGQGLAWVLKLCTQEEICGAFRASERTARAEKRGLWADRAPMPPWRWRNQR